MKTNHTFILLAAVFLTSLVGCTKDASRDFILKVHDYNGGSGKAYIENRFACWTDGDEVKINSQRYTVTVATPTSGTKQARIMHVPNAESYYAIYPASYCSSAMSNGASITLPATIPYETSGGYQVIKAPMAAKATSENVMLFYNLCTLMKVTVPASNTIITKIQVESLDGVSLSGDATVTFSGEVPSMGSLGGLDESNKVTLNLGTGVNISEGGVFYIPVPAIAPGSRFKIKIQDKFNASGFYQTTVSAIEAIPSNSIVEVTGPNVPANADYTFYEWIKSQGSGYIRLNERPTEDSELELTFSLLNTTSTQYLAGSRGTGTGSGGVQWFALGGSSSRRDFHARYCDEVVYNPVDDGGWTRQTGHKYRERMKVMVTPNSGGAQHYAHVTFEDITANLIKERNTPSTTQRMPSDAGQILLFALTTSNLHQGMKCYGFRVWQSNSLIADYVPCERVTDHKAGVYDMVNGIFIEPTPASSTATPFEVGND